MAWFKSLREKVKSFFKNQREKRYLERLKYARFKLKNPQYDEIAPDVREYKIEIIEWLIYYYNGEPHIVPEGPPEKKLQRLLSDSCEALSPRGRVHAKVLYDWIKNKRVEGY